MWGNITEAQSWNSPHWSHTPPPRGCHTCSYYMEPIIPSKNFFGRHRLNASCPRCGETERDLIHMFWRCPKLFRYWSEVLGTIDHVFGTSLDLDVRLCVIGLVEGEGNPEFNQVAVLRCLFQSALPPSGREWKHGMNKGRKKRHMVDKVVYGNMIGSENPGGR